jgi:hypothetical protein
VVPVIVTARAPEEVAGLGALLHDGWLDLPDGDLEVVDGALVLAGRALVDPALAEPAPADRRRRGRFVTPTAEAPCRLVVAGVHAVTVADDAAIGGLSVDSVEVGEDGASILIVGTTPTTITVAVDRVDLRLETDDDEARFSDRVRDVGGRRTPR